MPPFSFPLLIALCLLLYTTPAHAFGAGNIASIAAISGSNWRHGDIEDTLLELFVSAVREKKFSAWDVRRVYFGNWLRDYSQAVDVGALKNVEGETVRILVWILSFMTFGYATSEFEVTAERLGCYRPEEHIDNPKDYADNLDAREYDPRLRGPVDEETELAIDPETGMKNYIANEALAGECGWSTSSGLVKNLFGRSIGFARSYKNSGNKEEWYEALRLLGTGLHCLEDFPAHSNYTELALREMGEDSVFPHVGTSTEMEVQGRRVFPLVTGTFGGVDFLHSVLGEISDKAIQSEVDQLESAINSASTQSNEDGGETSYLRELLDQIPLDLLKGGNDSSDTPSFADQASDLERLSQERSRRQQEGEEGDDSENPLGAQIYSVLEFHDRLMKAVSAAIDVIPGLTSLMENISERMSIFIFSILAPYVLPFISQVKIELATGSTEVIASSQEKQYIVFDDDTCTDPTHSMLAKDHFTNVLNNPAGKVAAEIIRFVVPQIIAAFEDENVDVDSMLERALSVLHHPALRDERNEGQTRMFAAVQTWWDEKDEDEKEGLRYALGFDGVKEGANHNGEDSGHGCGGAGIGGGGRKDMGYDKDGSIVGTFIQERILGGEGGGGGDSVVGGYIQESILGGGDADSVVGSYMKKKVFGGLMDMF